MQRGLTVPTNTAGKFGGPDGRPRQGFMASDSKSHISLWPTSPPCRTLLKGLSGSSTHRRGALKLQPALPARVNTPDGKGPLQWGSHNVQRSSSALPAFVQYSAGIPRLSPALTFSTLLFQLLASTTTFPISFTSFPLSSHHPWHSSRGKKGGVTATFAS